MALTVVAAIPLAVMAGIIALQNYREAGQRAVERVRFLEGRLVARQDAASELITAVLQRAAAGVMSAPADAEVCDQTLRQYLAGSHDQFVNLTFLDTAGGLACSALNFPPGVPRGTKLAADLFNSARDSGAPAFSAVQDGKISHQRILLVAIPVMMEGRFAGEIAGSLRPDWLAEFVMPAQTATETAVWLLDSAGTVLVSQGSAATALPNPELLTALKSDGSRALSGRSVAGLPYAYASHPLDNGMRLIIAYNAAAEQARARKVLVRRVAEMGLMLLGGLAAIVLGADLAFARPLRRLSAAVARWQRTNTFEPGDLRFVPQELSELSGNFASAIGILRERETRLQQAQVQQTLLMQEIHHRVKNNLQIVASLLNLQASRIRSPETRAEFQAARDRVRALATLHRHLYSHGEVHTINMRSFLEELCGQLFQAMGETAGERITLSISAPELQMASDQAVPLALIVTEAVTNAMKYAFPAGRKGHIAVTMKADESTLDLVIEDDGVGIPAGRAMTETGVRDGIGLRLIRGFARQLGATLDVAESHGTRYAVHMPLQTRNPAPAALPALAAGLDGSDAHA